MDHQLNLQNSLGEICRFSILNSTTDFKALLKIHRPFIIKEFSASWPALSKWDLDYLLDKEKNSKVWIRDGKSAKPTIEHIHFSEFITQIQNNVINSNIGKNLYLVLSRIMSHVSARSVQLPKLLQDIILPNFIPFARLWEINLWIGYGSNRSNLHFDPEENLLVPIKGTKKVILINRSKTGNLYQNLEGNILESKVDVFNLDKKIFPKIDKIKFYQTTVEPGEALYIPSGWWHAVESSIDVNISVNIWWLPNSSFLLKLPTCRRLWQKKEKWLSVLWT